MNNSIIKEAISGEPIRFEIGNTNKHQSKAFTINSWRGHLPFR